MAVGRGSARSRHGRAGAYVSGIVSESGEHVADTIGRGVCMSLLLILIILLVLFGGGGLYLGGPRTGISLGGLILIVIVIMAVTGRL
jgi:hypothetical protein